MTISSLGRRLIAESYALLLASPTAELDYFAADSARNQREILARRLRELIRYFGTRSDALPEWRDAAHLGETEDVLALWPRLPIVSKALLRERFEPNAVRRVSGLPGRKGATGGSTGEPTLFFHDDRMVRASRALDLYSRRKMGWRPGMPTIAVWGSDRDIRPGGNPWRARAKSIRGDFVVDGYHLTERTAHETVRLIRQHAPVALFGFSSMLGHVAQLILDLGLSVPQGSVAVAWSGGEMLLEQHSRSFERAFHTPILNRYGGRELSTMACQYEAGGSLQVPRPWLMVEIVDDAGNVVGPGVPGRLLWTSTICRGTPFLRYEIGDLGSHGAEDVDESGIRAISQLHGRQAGVLQINGKSINGLFWNHLLKEFEEVRQFQIVLTRRGTLRLRFAGSGFEPSREARLRETLTRFLGSVPVSIEWGERLPLTAGGKLMQVVKESET